LSGDYALAEIIERDGTYIQCGLALASDAADLAEAGVAMKIRARGSLAMIQHWWKRHFDSAARADVLERCACCGQPFNARDLEQALPHFEHLLGLGAPRPEALVRHEDLPAQLGNVVPFRRRLEDAANRLRMAAAVRGRPGM
jgi:hypothetical protein